MIYKYELHSHTDEVSMCGKVPAAEIVRLHKENGYNGIVITDHYSDLTFFPTKLLTPQRHSDFYLSGYRNALKAADADFTVLLGMELRYYGTRNDYLVYGLEEDFFKKCGNLMAMYPKRFTKLARDYGAMIILAHPFRSRLMDLDVMQYIDGAEIYNGKAADDEENKKALGWAVENGLAIKTSGSDFHDLNTLAKGGITTDRRILCNADLLNVLRSGEFDIVETPIK